MGLPRGRSRAVRAIPTRAGAAGAIFVHRGLGGAPILAAAHAWLDCQVEGAFDIGDRTVFLAVRTATLITRLPALERRSHPCLLQRLTADTAQIHGARLAGHWRVLEWWDRGE